MAGYGLDPGEGFTEKLQAALHGQGSSTDVIANAGVSGDTTSGGLSRLDWSVPDGTQLVILELGANDMLRGVAPAITEKNLDAMLAKLQGAQDRRCCLPACAPRPISAATTRQAFDAIYPRLADKVRRAALSVLPRRRRRAIRSLQLRGRHASERRQASSAWSSAFLPVGRKAIAAKARRLRTSATDFYRIRSYVSGMDSIADRTAANKRLPLAPIDDSLSRAVRFGEARHAATFHRPRNSA